MEDLTKDILDEEFIDIFRWLHRFQNVLGYSRVEIKDRFVTPPKKSFIIYCFIMWTITIPASTFYYTMTMEIRKRDMMIDTIYVPYQFAVLSWIASYLVYCNHFDKSDRNCQLFLKLQKIDRLLGLAFVKNNKVLSIISNIYALSFFVGSFIWLIFLSKVHHTEGCFYLTCFMLLTPIAYSAETVVFILKLKYLIVRVEYIANELKNVHKRLMSEDLTVDLTERHSLYDTEELRLKTNINENLVRGIHAVLSSMLDIEEIYRHSIFCSIGAFLVLSHIVFLCVLSYFKIEGLLIDVVFGIIILYPLYLFTALLMSISGSTLSNELKQAKRICCALVSCPCADEMTVRNANRILLLLNAKSPTVSIYGLVTIDQNLPFQLLSIATTYTFLYMQFRALK